jgi:hypothetical protein
VTLSFQAWPAGQVVGVSESPTRPRGVAHCALEPDAGEPEHGVDDARPLRGRQRCLGEQHVDGAGQRLIGQPMRGAADAMPVRRSDKAIRRGIFHSVPELLDAIETYLATHNQDPRPFIWTATTAQILEKVRRGRVAPNAIASQNPDAPLARRGGKTAAAAR